MFTSITVESGGALELDLVRYFLASTGFMVEGTAVVRETVSEVVEGTVCTIVEGTVGGGRGGRP